MCAMHWRLLPGFRRTISTVMTDRQTGEGIADGIKRRQRDRGEKQYLAPRAQSRQEEADRSHRLSATTSRVARRWLTHLLHSHLSAYPG